MTELTREQKKELLMRELELVDEAQGLKNKLNQVADHMDKIVQYIRQVATDGHNLSCDVTKEGFDVCRQMLDMNAVTADLRQLEKIQTELGDTRRILSYVRKYK